MSVLTFIRSFLESTDQCNKIKPLYCFNYFHSFQLITNSGFRVCAKELFVQRFDPLTVSYAVLAGE